MVAAQLSLHFPGGYVTWKNKKVVEYLRHHSTDFHQVFTTIIALSGHLVTDDFENVDQYKNKKMLFFDIRIFLKKLPTSNFAVGNKY